MNRTAAPGRRTGNRPTSRHERRLRKLGHTHVAGLDEAGRGALAGPVVAAAVLLPEKVRLADVRDSKLIPEREREELYDRVTGAAIAWGVGIIDNATVDRIDILQATFEAMRRAVASMPIEPDYVIIDGRDAPEVGVPCEALIKGDRACLSIAAASILAKVTRDRIMRSEHDRFPAYQFQSNKGYATAAHRAALEQNGPCTLHRLTFVRSYTQQRLEF